MSHTTTQTPAAARRTRLIVNTATAVLATAAVVVGYADLKKYDILPSDPAVSVSTSCDDLSGTSPSVYVTLRHFSGPHAEVVLYTAGDAWSNSDNPPISHGRGSYAVGDVPSGPVTVEVTDPGHKVITKYVDVPRCERP